MNPTGRSNDARALINMPELARLRSIEIRLTGRTFLGVPAGRDGIRPSERRARRFQIAMSVPRIRLRMVSVLPFVPRIDEDKPLTRRIQCFWLLDQRGQPLLL
jgi:hypothetical protein